MDKENKIIRVLHVYKTSLPQSRGGIESFIHGLCDSTSFMGPHGKVLKNHVFSLKKNPSKKPLKVGSYTVWQGKEDVLIGSASFSFSALFLFKKLAKKADLIHYHFPNPFGDILYFITSKKPSLVTYHCDIVKQKNLLKIYRPLQNAFLRSVQHIVTTSPHYFKTSPTLQKFSHKVSIIPIGIDISRYPKLSKNRLEYWKNNLPQPFFLFIGAMRYYKGLHIALEAVTNTSINLVVAGANVQSTHESVHQYAAKKESNIVFLGKISEEDKVALLHLCFGFLFPSCVRSEAFGIALLEASAYGKPLISCDIGTGTSYINLHDETGLVVQPHSPEQLRDAMFFLLDNPSMAQKFGDNALKRAQQVFSLDYQGASYWKLYEKLISDQKKI